MMVFSLKTTSATDWQSIEDGEGRDNTATPLMMIIGDNLTHTLIRQGAAGGKQKSQLIRRSFPCRRWAIVKVSRGGREEHV